MNYANYRANNQFGELIGLVQHKIDKEISQKNPRDTDIKHLISLLLYSIIGYFMVTTPDDDICKEAKRLLSELKKAVVIMVLFGEYIDHLLDVINDISSDFEQSTIILYLDAIADSSSDASSFMDRLYSTLAHEYFHFHHYYDIYEKYCRPSYGITPQYKLELSAYNPGKIVKESLASYFECEYMIRHGFAMNMFNSLKTSWSSNSWRCWPYSGARLIQDDGHFQEIFLTSLNSFDNAARTLGI